jgi:hypothetical protein
LVPVTGDVAVVDQELRRAIAKASLRQAWAQAEVDGSDLITDAEIDQVIDLVRTARVARKARRDLSFLIRTFLMVQTKHLRHLENPTPLA